MAEQTEYMATEHNDLDAWRCICGNTPSADESLVFRF